jgi:hypothetical protein
MKLPQLNEVWTHFKGGKYRICAFAWNAVGDTLVLMVMYQVAGTCSGDSVGPVFTRTISNFLEPVNGCPRFEKADG